MASPSAGCALPVKTLSSRLIDRSRRSTPACIRASTRHLAGAEGFEPSNTGFKAPRLTAWPRPNRGLLARSGASALRRLRAGRLRARGSAGRRRRRRRRPAACTPTSTFSSRYCRIWLLSGCAMSLNVPSFRFLLGIETNSPLGPWMILMSVTTKHWSNTIDTNALSFSSSTGMTLTSVISMMSAPSLVRSRAPRQRPKRPATSARGTGPGRASGAGGPRSPRRRRAAWARRARCGIVEQAEVRRPAPGERRQHALPPGPEYPGCGPTCVAQVRGFLQGRLLEVVGEDAEGVRFPPSPSIQSGRSYYCFPGVSNSRPARETRPRSRRAARDPRRPRGPATCRRSG